MESKLSLSKKGADAIVLGLSLLNQRADELDYDDRAAQLVLSEQILSKIEAQTLSFSISEIALIYLALGEVLDVADAYRAASAKDMQQANRLYRVSNRIHNDFEQTFPFLIE